LGLTVKILSGDSKDVCAAVACKLGLVADCSAVMTGAEFERKTPEEKERIVTTYNVFARVSPENKHEIIKLLSKDHDVGYMGDGINDVLALKEAHVGLVVADAVDVARSAADIILLKKSLMVVVDGIEEGRLVFANTVKYLRTTLSASFGNFYSVGLAALILDYLPLLPIQILLLNLMSDFPMITIATDNVSKAELKRPETYDVKSTLILALFLGFICTIFDFIFFAFFFHENPAILQTGWFIESILTELVFIFSIRTNKFFLKGGLPSAGLILISLATGILAVILPFTFLGHYLFELVPLHRKHFIIIGGVVVGYFIVSELIKLVYIRVQPKKNNVSAPKHIERKIS
ncbi:MAG TPA: HAD-IC family P-type ATPase, partial [Candidatus Limnocylindria bacterium]|nr:HAD-IC family P-type ATPase [Candidatus Limnocylindria bacterium]